MSPPCLATIFEGDNGGATSKGITGTEIRVAVPVRGLETFFLATIDALFAYFNQRFELYGRKLVPVYVVGTAGNAISARANAADAAAQNVFAAVTGAQEWQVGQVALPAELARQKIVTVVRGASSWWTDRTLYDSFHPYVWSVYPSSEDMQANLASFICTSLAGRPARHAGDANLRVATRTFGILSLGQESAPSATALAQAVGGCSDSAPVRFDWISTNAPAGSLRTGLERLRSAGATTLICVCEGGNVSNATSEANTLGYFPEWLLTPSYLRTGNDEHWLQPKRAANQIAPPLLLSAGPRLLPTQARPWFGALQSLLTTPPAGAPPVDTMAVAEFMYGQMLVLASGIQAAGPMLTPDTFAAGLMNTAFPNPGAGQAPYWQPSAGFGPGDHSFYDDYFVGWWSDAAEALDMPTSTKPAGSWCYLQQAARFRPGTYPADADARLFNPAEPCR